MTKIYVLERNGVPFYIGKANDTIRRKHKHYQTYGTDITLSIIDEVEDWKYWEEYWIEQFKVWGFNLLNQNKGGGGPVFISMIDSFGKVKADSTAYINDDSPSSNILVNAHKAPVQDIAFSSFHDSIMATGSADSTVIVYSSCCNC